MGAAQPAPDGGGGAADPATGIVGHRAHCYIGEMGGASAHGGVIFRLVDNDERGMINLDQVYELLNPKDEPAKNWIG